MAGRGSQSFQKRQKEQQRKERQQEKFAKRLAKKHQPLGSADEEQPLEPTEESAGQDAGDATPE